MRRGVECDLFQQYKNRIKWPLTLREIDERGFSLKKQREKESQALLSAIPKAAVAVVLDERGENLSSEELAHSINTWREDRVQNLVFLIGGSNGLSQNIRDRADLILAFGKATWPHLLIRGMLAEQIYRAQQILLGHPYHRS